MEEKKYSPCDLDVNGNPYSDAIPLGDQEFSAEEDFAKAKATTVSIYKPAHWPFIPSPGETIVIQSSSSMSSAVEKVVKVDLAGERIFTTYTGVLSWLFDTRFWNSGFQFSRYSGQKNILVR